MKKFEYSAIVLRNSIDACVDDLTKMGIEGWELVAVTSPSESAGCGEYHPVAYLKREYQSGDTREK